MGHYDETKEVREAQEKADRERVELENKIIYVGKHESYEVSGGLQEIPGVEHGTNLVKNKLIKTY